MEIELYQEIKKGATIIEGFAGFGLVGTIASEYLIDHLGAKQIGKITSDKVPAIVAIHEGEVIEPYAIFYDAKNNIVLLRAIASVSGMEWEIADAVLKLSQDIKAKEIIEIEGVGGAGKNEDPKTFYYSKVPARRKRFESLGVEEMREGIIVGVTASLLSKLKDGTFVFAESHSDLPDSRAAAKVIEVIDKYLNLNVDYKPLLNKAESFEKKVRELLVKGIQTKKEKTKMEGSDYIG